MTNIAMNNLDNFSSDFLLLWFNKSQLEWRWHHSEPVFFCFNKVGRSRCQSVQLPSWSLPSLALICPANLLASTDLFTHYQFWNQCSANALKLNIVKVTSCDWSTTHQTTFLILSFICTFNGGATVKINFAFVFASGSASVDP